MNGPAKDEAELMERVAATLWRYQGAHHAEIAIAAIRAAGWAVVPVEPTDGLLMSMALRADHALGCSGYYDVQGGEPWQTHARHLEMAISEARKQHEEVVGTGFYKPEHDDTYRAMIAAAPGGEAMNERVFVRSRLLHAEAQEVLAALKGKPEAEYPEVVDHFTALMLRARAAENLAFGRLMLAKAYLKSARRVEAGLQ